MWSFSWNTPVVGILWAENVQFVDDAGPFPEMAMPRDPSLVLMRMVGPPLSQVDDRSSLFVYAIEEPFLRASFA